MDLRKTLTLASQTLTKANINHALIGGFSMAAHGVPRATQDIDFLADGTKSADIKNLLIQQGFKLNFESTEVLQFSGIGFLDILLANRPLSQKMLHEAQSIATFPVKVLRVEDIIGLKIQAYHNDPSRKLQDQADIQALFRNHTQLSKEKVKQYADLYTCWPEIESILK